MIYLYGFLVGAQIVLGQFLWKLGIGKYGLELKVDYIFSLDFLKFLTAPFIILGALSYASATVMYILLLSKFQYSQFQSVVVVSSLIMTFVVAGALLNEKLQAVHLVGLVLLLIGIVLVNR